MRKLILGAFAFFLFFTVSARQKSLDENEKLFATAKVWVFLKYYHPKVAMGELDWDAKFLEILPSIEKAANREELSSIYIALLESLGEVKSCKTCSARSDHTALFEENFDLSWIENEEIFTPQLSERLRHIEKNRNTGKNHFVSFDSKTESLTFSNEKDYPDFDWEDRSLRLLSFLRYWNTIEYFYPHKYQMDADWDAVFFQMLPRFNAPSTEEDYHLAMLELVVKIDDSHGDFGTSIIADYFGKKEVPAGFDIIDGKIVITKLYDDSFARVNDIRIGDVISKVDGQSVEQKLAQGYRDINGSNNAAKKKHALRWVLHGSSDSVKVEVVRSGMTASRDLGRYPFSQFKPSKDSKPNWEILAKNIGYINLNKIDKKELLHALELLVQTQARH